MRKVKIVSPWIRSQNVLYFLFKQMSKNYFENNFVENNCKDKTERSDEQKDEDCVPDSSNAHEEESHEEEQHSSGSVDEELLEEDDGMDTKHVEEEEAITEEKPSGPSSTTSPAGVSPAHSLVGELMNKFGFSDILEYQEAYRKAVQESRGSLRDMEVDGDNNNEELKSSDPPKEPNGLKLRSDITIDSEQNFNKLSKSEIFQNFETLKRLRPDYNGRVPERETLFAGMLLHGLIEGLSRGIIMNINSFLPFWNLPPP